MDRLSADVGRVEVVRTVRALRRGWWLIVLAMLLGLVGGYLFGQSRPQTYSSTAAVLVLSTGVQKQAVNANADVSMDTEVQLLESATVVNATRTLLHTTTAAADLLSNTSVFVPPNTRILQISFVGTIPAAAQAGARAFATAYIGARTDAAVAAAAEQLAALDKLAADVQDKLVVVTGQEVSFPVNSADRSLADAQRNVLTSQIADLHAQTDPLRAAPTLGGKIINDALLPSSSSGLPSLLIPLSGLMVGLLLGIALALMRGRLDRRLLSKEDVAHQMGHPVLVDVPSGPEAAGAALYPVASAAGQQFVELRLAVLSRVAAGGQVVAVAAASSGDGATAVSLNLAASLARSGARVALVVADAGSPMSEVLQHTLEPGLAEILRGEASLAAALLPGPVSGLVVCGPGSRLREEDEHLESTRMDDIVAEARRGYQFVVVETPSPGRGAQAQSLARSADLVLLVVERRRTTRPELALAQDQMARLGIAVHGVVTVGRLGERSAQQASEVTAAQIPAPSPSPDRADARRS